MLKLFANTKARVKQKKSLILWFEDLRLADLPLVGGRNACIGEMIQQLELRLINVPQGFAITAEAYRYFIEYGGLESELRRLLAGLDIGDMKNLRQRGKEARSLIVNTLLPPALEQEIAIAYKQLCDLYGNETDVAVRSSVTAEDFPNASFAGQQETYLNVHGIKGIWEATRKCFASLFTDGAISYRSLQGFDHFDVALSVGVQKMVRSDLATSGVMFSIDAETKFKNAVIITAAYGLGKTIVQGTVNPDEFIVFKPMLREGFRPIIAKRLGSKAVKMVYDRHQATRIIPVPETEQQKFALSDEEILKLAKWAQIIEEHYNQIRGCYSPMNIEWAKDGETGELFIVQARPETVQSQKSDRIWQQYRLQGTAKVLVEGRAVGDRIGQGKTRLILNVQHIHEFKPGEILVTQKTDPDWEPIMKKASAIITNSGGRTCHAAIIAREMGIPAIVGCGNATDILRTGQAVTVSCAEGEVGKVYQGLVPFAIAKTLLDDLPKTRTQILLNISNPAEAFSLASQPCDGVGLARLEFIIANQIRIHPLALIHFDQLQDQAARQEIEKLTAGFNSKPDYFISQLAQGIGTIAAAFYPKPVIVRMSDLKSNEYANLLGGRQFEPIEENPMIGWRGASRYTDPKYRQAFALECQAIKQVRDEMGLANVIPMIPFCRTPEEGQQVLAEMAKHGLKRGENNLQVYVMCELPSNVLLADQFCQVFDGFSIGSNDLTQLTLGLDRDSGLVAHIFDERDEAVKRMIKMLIQTAKRHDRPIGICGQAPSDYPEFTRFLVNLGIDSISLNPDSLLKTLLEVAKIEK